jgi:hypothetical protein
MNKFKVPALIFAAVFVISATALFFYVKNDLGDNNEVKIEAPAWVNKNGSSGKRPVSDKIAESELKPTPSLISNGTDKKETVIKDKKDQAPAEKANQTAPAPLEKAVDKIKESIITEVFLDNLAQYVADCYHPAHSLPYKAEQAFSSASFKGVNMHFGLNLRGLMPEAGTLVAARKLIWSYLLTPGKIEELSKSEVGPILDLIEEKGILAERKFVEGDTFSVRELTRSQRAEMFRVSAQPIRHVAKVLKAVSDNQDLIQALDSFTKAQKRVDSANGIFQLDLDKSRNSNSEQAHKQASHSGKLLKEAITIREKIKTGITEKIKTYCAGDCDEPDDSFYIARWVFRRVVNDQSKLKSIAAGSKILEEIASKMENRADAIEKSM